MGMKRPMAFPCLICGVDDGPIRDFILIFIGALVLGTLLLMLWALATGRLGTGRDNNFQALDAEARDDKGDL